MESRSSIISCREVCTRESARTKKKDRGESACNLTSNVLGRIGVDVRYQCGEGWSAVGPRSRVDNIGTCDEGKRAVDNIYRLAHP